MVKVDVKIAVFSKKPLYCYCFISLCTFILTEITSNLPASVPFRTYSPCTRKGSKHLVWQASRWVEPECSTVTTGSGRACSVFIHSEHCDCQSVYTSILGFQGLISTITTFGFTTTFPTLETVQYSCFCVWNTISLHWFCVGITNSREN